MSLSREANKFYKLETIADYGHLVKNDPSKLALMALNPRYQLYKIRKKTGGMRHIEDPEIRLKVVLQRTNQFLQAVYYALRPPAVYGFCISTNNDEDRNIIGNAKQHIDHPYMLNIDLQDFFHTITRNRVYGIYESHFPSHSHQLTELLTSLCCFNMRLPMGSPTSPVLSNFACLDLDAELINFCNSSGITYSRFADDLCFSAMHPIGKSEIVFFRNSIKHYNFIINENKVKSFDKEDEKMVTGIVVGSNEISLPVTYLQQLEIEIDRYRQVRIAESRFNTGMSLKKLKLFEQELQGKWNFANMVMPEREEVYNLKERMENAFEPPESFESENWLDLPYDSF